MCYINDRARDNGLVAITRPELDDETGQKVYDFYDANDHRKVGDGLVGRPAAYEWVIRYEEGRVGHPTHTTSRG